MTARVFLSLCESDGLQDFVTVCHGVRKTLQSRCELFKFVSAEVTVTGARGQDEVVVGHGNVESVCAADKHAFPVLVDSCDLALGHRRVFLVAKNSPERKANLAGA